MFPEHIYPLDMQQHERMQGNMHNNSVDCKTIPITYYIARNNSIKAIELLKDYGIKINNSKPDVIARALEAVIKNGNDKDTAKILDIHPDKEILIDKAKQFDGFSFEGEKNIVKQVEKAETPAQQIQSPSLQSEQMWNVKTVYTIFGVAIALTSIAAISWGIKNIKQ